MKIYLAGPMRGIPEFNFPTFNDTTARLRAEGHVVFNPAERDNERHGVDISKGNETGSEEHASKQHGFSLREALGEDLAWITSEAEAIYLLPGWKQSSGAAAEHATAKALGLKVVELPGKKPKRALPTEYLAAIDLATAMVKNELIAARSRYGRFHGPHEAYGVLLEEVDEMWDDIKHNRPTDALKEAVQVAAMAISFITDLYPMADLGVCTREGLCRTDHVVCNGTRRHDP